MGQPTVWTIKKMRIVFAIWIIGLSVFFGEVLVSRADEGPVGERPGVSSSVENGPSVPEQDRGFMEGNKENCHKFANPTIVSSMHFP